MKNNNLLQIGKLYKVIREVKVFSKSGPESFEESMWVKPTENKLFLHIGITTTSFVGNSGKTTFQNNSYFHDNKIWITSAAANDSPNDYFEEVAIVE